MRRHRFPILLAAVFAAFSLLAGAAPQLDYDVEAPIDEKNKGFEEREVHKNTTAVCSDLLPGGGTAEDPFVISHANDLLYLSEQVNAGNKTYCSAYYVQSTDIDLTGSDYTPIGTQAHPFSGSYDGANHRILYKNAVYEGDLFGVFGYALAADFQNMDIYMEADVTYKNLTDLPEDKNASLYAGLLCGVYQVAKDCNSTVSGCRTDGKLTATNTKRTVHAAGLFGLLSAKTVYYGDVLVIDCESAADITANAYSSPYAAGIAARAETQGRGRLGFERCFVSGNVVACGYSTESYSAYASGIAACLYIDESDWSVWSELSDEPDGSKTSNAVDTNRIKTALKACVVASETLHASLSKQHSQSTAYVDWLAASISEYVTLSNNYYLKNDTIVCNGSNLAATKIETKEQLYLADFLSGTLSYDLNGMWNLTPGKSLSLRFDGTRIWAYRDGSQLVLLPIGGTSGSLVLSYCDQTGRPLAFDVVAVNAENNRYTAAIPPFDGTTLSLTVLWLDQNGLRPLADACRLSL